MATLQIHAASSDGLAPRPFLAAAPDEGDTPSSAAGSGADPEAIRLYRVVGDRELAMLEQTSWSALPSRDAWSVIALKLLPEDEAYTLRARSRRGQLLSIVSLDVTHEFAREFQVRVPDLFGGHWEYWVDATRLDELNAAIRGPISVVA